MSRSLKVVLPDSVWVPTPVPLKTTLPAPGVNEPLLLQFPLMLTVDAVPTSKVPVVMVKSCAVRLVVPPATLRIWAVLLTVILLKVWVTAVPWIFCPAPVFWNVTVLVPGVNVPPLLIQLPPERLTPCDPGEKVPEDRVKSPATVN